MRGISQMYSQLVHAQNPPPSIRPAVFYVSLFFFLYLDRLIWVFRIFLSVTHLALCVCKFSSFLHLWKYLLDAISRFLVIKNITYFFIFLSILGYKNFGFFEFFCQLHTQLYVYANFQVHALMQVPQNIDTSVS